MTGKVEFGHAPENVHVSLESHDGDINLEDKPIPKGVGTADAILLDQLNAPSMKSS